MADKIMGYLQSENYALVFIFIAVSAFINSFKLIDFYYSHKKRRVTDLEVAIKSKYISPSFRSNLKDEIESEYFKVAHGVKASKEMIDTMLFLYKQVDKRVSFKHFVRTIKMHPDTIETSNLPYHIQLSFMDKLFAIYNVISGFTLLITGVFTFIIQISWIGESINLHSIFLSAFMSVVGFFMLLQGAPIHSVFLINRELRNAITSTNNHQA